MAKFKTQFSDYKGTKSNLKHGPSKTVPDMSKTIRELYTSNVRQTIHSPEPQYFEDEIIPVFQDLTELHEYKQQKIKEIEETLEKAQKETADKMQKDLDKKLEKERELIEKAKEELRKEKKD